MALLQRMRAQGVTPDAISYQSAISACRAGGDGTSALMLLKEMDEEGLTPKQSDYSIVIETVGRDGDWLGAVELLKKMQEDGIQPDAYSFGAAVGACAKVGRFCCCCCYFFVAGLLCVVSVSCKGKVCQVVHFCVIRLQ